MRNLKYYIKNLAKLSPIASKSVKKCELENSKHRIRQVCLPEMPCNRMHPPFCLYNFYNPYIEKKQPLLFLLLNIEKSLLLKDVLYLRTLYFSISFSYSTSPVLSFSGGQPAGLVRFLVDILSVFQKPVKQFLVFDKKFSHSR